MKTFKTKVAGVTYPNADGTSRQDIIARCSRSTPVRLEPEPDNPYDEHAIAVKVATEPGKVEHCGYIPRNLAAIIEPHLQGESLMAKILEVVGGFEFDNGETASLGLLIQIEVPDPDDDDQDNGQRHIEGIYSKGL